MADTARKAADEAQAKSRDAQRMLSAANDRVKAAREACEASRCLEIAPKAPQAPREGDPSAKPSGAGMGASSRSGGAEGGAASSIASKGQTRGANASSLAVTGVDFSGLLALLGASALAGGATLVAARRRR